MKIKSYIDRLLDLSIIFSFDHSGFKRHCPDQLKKVDLSGSKGVITGASSGIGLAAAKTLMQQGMNCVLIGRRADKFKENFLSEDPLTCILDMADLKKVYDFARNEVHNPIDLLIHNAGAMPDKLSITNEGFEQMFASQVLGPFILTKTLADSGKLKKGCRIIFVSSGGMYLQKLDLKDLLCKNNKYNKYAVYANAKRAQVILSEQFAKKYPQYLFSAMHPGWVDTPGVSASMPTFKKLMGKRLRSSEEGADTILWLATADGYPSGKFWFDRKQAKTTILNFNQSTNDEKESLWKYCESIFHSMGGEGNQ